ncbi:unnamed protein product [Rotaria sp. Silwood1]|nr:unnamed protein product [Rotaria sp. Silwood1]CAF1639835.1 unnamed protein product [Rotaria sp. Silwood1]CAF3855521.1 unnamed protein product [Rotaria sp. Silwood1]CAF4902687.1 unnamed protein product [Rotaria sp. Silwood1]
MGVLYRQVRKDDLASNAFNTALQKAENNALSQDYKSSILSNLALLMFQTGDYKRGYSILDTLRSLEHVENNEENECGNLYNMALIRFHQGDFIGALNYFEEALNKAKNITSGQLLMISIDQNMALAHCRLGNMQQARQACEQAEKMMKKYSPSTHPTLADLYLTYAIVLFESGESYHQQSLEYLEKALRIESVSTDFDLRARIYNGLAGIYTQFGDTDRALDYCRQTLALRSSLATDVLGDVYMKMAQIYANSGDDKYEEAVELMNESITLFSSVLPDHHPRLAFAHHQLAVIYANWGKEPNKALGHLEKAYDIAHYTLPSNHPQIAMLENDILTVFAQIALKCLVGGDREEAIAYLEKYFDPRITGMNVFDYDEFKKLLGDNYHALLIDFEEDIVTVLDGIGNA